MVAEKGKQDLVHTRAEPNFRYGAAGWNKHGKWPVLLSCMGLASGEVKGCCPRSLELTAAIRTYTDRLIS